MQTQIPGRIVDLLTPVAQTATVADVRIGLKYTSVRLDSGQCGISWTGHEGGGCCGQDPDAVPLAGRPAMELLVMLTDRAPLRRTIGLATANALAAGMPRPEASPDDVLDLVGIGPADRVVMVGLFGPLMPPLRQSGCRLDVLELNERPGTISPRDGRTALAECSVAIITGTSLVTGTLDDLLASLGSPRAAVMLGPSTFMRPEAYAGTPVTHLAGARVRDAAGLERIISEGGGTRILKRHMDFETIVLAARPT